MPTNYPGPYELRFIYQTAISGFPTLTHQLRLSFEAQDEGDPGDPISEWTMKRRGGGVVDAETWATDFATILKTLLDTNADILTVELWKYDTGTFNAAFQTVEPLNIAGTAGGSGNPDGQQIITFRSQNGGIAKVDVRRGVVTKGASQAFPTGSTPVNNLAAIIAEPTSPIKARDNGYLFAALRYLPGENEKLFKNRARQ